MAGSTDRATLSQLLGRMDHDDPDYRYMSLNDLQNLLKAPGSSWIHNEPHTAKIIVDSVVKSLQDNNSEVQNIALKCQVPLVGRLPSDVLAIFIEKLADICIASEPTLDSSVPSSALIMIVTSLPRPLPGTVASKSVTDAYTAISKKLIPRLVNPPRKDKREKNSKGVAKGGPEKGYTADVMDILIEVSRNFGLILTEAELLALENTAMGLINEDKVGGVVKKKAVAALAILMNYLSDVQLSNLVSSITESLRGSHLTSFRRRYLITLIGSLARANPTKFGSYLKTLAPFVLSALSEEEVSEAQDPDSQGSEVLEAALISLETLLGSCGGDMRSYAQDSVDAAVRCLRFDPNIAPGSDDEEMGGTQDEDDEDDEDDLGDDSEFEAEVDDIDDESWKVRRCAAKALYTVATTGLGQDLLADGSLYQKVGTKLVNRFAREREDSVKIEVIGAMSAVVLSTGSDQGLRFSDSKDGSLSPLQISRKRRRQLSDASMYEFQQPHLPSADSISPIIQFTPTGAEAQLARLNGDIVTSIAKLWKKASVPTKQAAILLLKNITIVLHGGVAQYLQQLEDPIIDALKGSAQPGLASAAGLTLQIEALAFVSAVAEVHRSSLLLPHFKHIVPAVIASVRESNYRVSSAGLGAVEQIVKVFTPPRVSSVEQSDVAQLKALYDVVKDRVSATKADLEVRHRAIRALGSLLARTTGDVGSKLVQSTDRSEALNLLLERLKNETTRLYAARAIGEVIQYVTNKKDVNSAWVRTVSLELADQLRKTNRSLRGSCIETLKIICTNPVSLAYLDNATVKEVSALLLPLLTTGDLHLLSPALFILSRIIQPDIVSPEMISALCEIVKQSLSGSVLSAYLHLIKTIGEQTAGRALMYGLLQDVGTRGDPTIVGKAIGTLVVYGGSEVGVTLDDFLGELQRTPDYGRKCLALSILGEVALRMGTGSPLKPDLFMEHFQSDTEMVRLAAAIALGSAASSNIQLFLPIILDRMEEPDSKYLLLHSIKEILQHPRSVRQEVVPYSRRLWDYLVSASYEEDNRAIGAECLGRLALLEPSTFLPLLQDGLKDSDPAVRGTVVQAFRFTLSDLSDSYNEALKPLIVPMITTMIADTELENTRLAFTTLNSALHNKIDLLVPYLPQLVPYLLQATQVNDKLIREVQMGPFKHKVDDGLEVRKSAYETLYALLDSPVLSRSDIPQIYSRITAGVDDEHDIRVIANLMITKLIVLAPEVTKYQLNALSERFRVILSFKPKESAVKQELEKAAEANKSVLRVTRELNRAFPTAGAGVGVVGADAGEFGLWKTYWEWVRREFSPLLRELDDEAAASQ